MSKNKIAFAAGLVALAVSVGIAGAQSTSTGGVKASRYKAVTAQPTEMSYGISYGRDFIFSKTGDGIGAASRIYKDNREDVSEFVMDEVGTERDGAEKAYTNFTKHYNVNKEEVTYVNFVTRFWTPHRFIMFADYTEKLVDEKKEDFGFTITASREDINRFMFNYFSAKDSNWNPDMAYGAFKRTFGAEDMTFAFFRDYIYVPGLLRTIGNKTIIGLKSTNITATEVTR